MNKKWMLVVAALAGLWPAEAKDLQDLRVLYVGSERAAEYVSFLKENVAYAEARDRDAFKPAEAAGFDVVLLDWPQNNGASPLSKLRSPLGPRSSWSKPTVLLGSAGLHLAVCWELEGGIGCTCLSPLAYDLHDHEIFRQPFHIDLTKTTRIPTPADFKDEIKAPEIEVIPLVKDFQRDWFPGWCSYSRTFEQDPEVEFFCGGVNHKTPTAAAIWRQGNLLHFGFEQSPAEMNETGQKLLLNAIAYISHFVGDRPIAVKRSAFLGQVSRTRKAIQKDLESPKSPSERLAEDLAGELWATVAAMTPEARIAWAETNARFLHPNTARRMERDTDLAALGLPFDSPEFFDKAIAGLREGGAAADRAKKLLQRYVQASPVDKSVDGWTAWWRENKAYLFGSDEGEYLWYIDGWAKRRGVPTQEFRGPSRADPTPIAAAR
jgi:hypothetical protein